MRFLHTMIRVGNLDKSVAFYTQVLGMHEISRREVPEGKYTNVFVGYGSKSDVATLELTFNWGVEKYELGSGFGHLAVGADDIYALCDKVRAAGGKVTREPGPVKFGTTVIAFIEDPDGYKIELIQSGS